MILHGHNAKCNPEIGSWQALSSGSESVSDESRPSGAGFHLRLSSLNKRILHERVKAFRVSIAKKSMLRSSGL